MDDTVMDPPEFLRFFCLVFLTFLLLEEAIVSATAELMVDSSAVDKVDALSSTVLMIYVQSHTLVSLCFYANLLNGNFLWQFPFSRHNERVRGHPQTSFVKRSVTPSEECVKWKRARPTSESDFAGEVISTEDYDHEEISWTSRLELHSSWWCFMQRIK